MKCLNLKQLVLFSFEMMKKWSPTAKTRMLCKFCNTNVNVVEKNYIKNTKVSYNEEKARVLLANRVGYHDNTYILTCER